MLKDTIDWLISVEDGARVLYEKAAELFRDDEGFAALLRSLAADEKRHYEMVLSAGRRLDERGDEPAPLVSIDADIKDNLNAYLNSALKKIEGRAVTKEELMDIVISIEYSECNEIFTYVVNSLSDNPVDFFAATANIDRHKGSIESFISSRPEFGRLLEKTKSIPNVSEKHILAVDDDKGMLDMYEIFFSREGVVEKARNGAEAMKMLGTKNYSAVISDVDMPVMNGMELYRQATDKYPYLKYRFLFLTGSYNADCIMFFKENNLANYMKPVSLKEIRLVISNIVKN